MARRRSGRRGISRRSVSLTCAVDFQNSAAENWSGHSESERFLDADIYCHGLVGALGFQSRGEWDQDGTDWSVGLADQFAAEAHHGMDCREDDMRVSEDWIPNKALQATPVGARVAFLSRRPGVPELGRYAEQA